MAATIRPSLILNMDVDERQYSHHGRTMPRKRAPRERGPLDIIIANGSSEPIYEQIFLAVSS